jgi:hypothetical protein
VSAPTTIADLWQRHADRTLPITASHAQVMRAKREFYAQHLERLVAMESRSAADEALFQEALGFGRAIGTAAEAAI